MSLDARSGPECEPQRVQGLGSVLQLERGPQFEGLHEAQEQRGGRAGRLAARLGVAGRHRDEGQGPVKVAGGWDPWRRLQL